MARTAKELRARAKKQVLQSLADGLSMPRIASELGIALRTVESHVVGAKNKLAAAPPKRSLHWRFSVVLFLQHIA